MWRSLTAVSAICLGGVTVYQSTLWLETGYWMPISFRLAWFALFGGLPYWAWWDTNGILLRATDLPLSLWLSVATLLFITFDMRWRKGARSREELRRLRGSLAERFRARRQRQF